MRESDGCCHGRIPSSMSIMASDSHRRDEACSAGKHLVLRSRRPSILAPLPSRRPRSRGAQACVVRRCFPRGTACKPTSGDRQPSPGRAAMHRNPMRPIVGAAIQILATSATSFPLAGCNSARLGESWQKFSMSATAANDVSFLTKPRLSFLSCGENDNHARRGFEGRLATMPLSVGPAHYFCRGIFATTL